MWSIVAQVSSGFALAAFFIAAIVTVLWRKDRRKSELIKLAPTKDRARLVVDALEFFRVESAGLSPKDQYRIALEQIRARQNRFKHTAVVVCLLAIIAALLAAFAIVQLQTPTDSQGDLDDSGQILLPSAEETPVVAATVNISGEREVVVREYNDFVVDVVLKGYGPQEYRQSPGEGWKFDLEKEFGTTQIAGEAGTCYGVDEEASNSQGILVKANNSSTRRGFPPERREGWVKCQLTAQRYRERTQIESFELPKRNLLWTQPLYVDLPMDRISFVASITLFDGSEVAVNEGAVANKHFRSFMVNNRLVIQAIDPH